MSRRQTVAASVLWLTLVVLTATLSALASAHDTLPGDTGIASWLQDLAFPGETLADAVRAVTSTEVVLGTGAALALLLWMRGYRTEALIFAAGLVILPLLQSGVKEIVDRPRPTEELVQIRASFSSPSFPAGHVMSPTYLYGFLLYLAISSPIAATPRITLGFVLALVPALSGLASVWLGVHWPSDVLGGYAWGTALLAPVVFTLAQARLRR